MVSIGELLLLALLVPAAEPGADGANRLTEAEKKAAEEAMRATWKLAEARR